MLREMGSEETILIADGEPLGRETLKALLMFQGYRLEFAHNGPETLTKVIKIEPDLLLLDVMMPKMSRFDVCKKAREKGIRTPIIMLTAKGEEIDKVLGLELGADDYVTKPFSLRELLARVKAVLRRVEDASPSTQNQITIGNLVVDFSTYDAFVAGKPEPMSHKEFEILKFLWQHQGQTVSRDQLLNDVWGYDQFPTTRTVDNFMLKLRKRIENDPAHPRHILTVHGIGYKLLT